MITIYQNPQNGRFYGQAVDLSSGHSTHPQAWLEAFMSPWYVPLTPQALQVLTEAQLGRQSVDARTSLERDLEIVQSLLRNLQDGPPAPAIARSLALYYRHRVGAGSLEHAAAGLQGRLAAQLDLYRREHMPASLSPTQEAQGELSAALHEVISTEATVLPHLRRALLRCFSSAPTLQADLSKISHAHMTLAAAAAAAGFDLPNLARSRVQSVLRRVADDSAATPLEIGEIGRAAPGGVQLASVLEMLVTADEIHVARTLDRLLGAPEGFQWVGYLVDSTSSGELSITPQALRMLLLWAVASVVAPSSETPQHFAGLLAVVGQAQDFGRQLLDERQSLTRKGQPFFLPEESSSTEASPPSSTEASPPSSTEASPPSLAEASPSSTKASPPASAGSLAHWCSLVRCCCYGYPVEPHLVLTEPVCRAIARELQYRLYEEPAFDRWRTSSELDPRWTELANEAGAAVRANDPTGRGFYYHGLTDRDWLAATRLASRALAVASFEVVADMLNAFESAKHVPLERVIFAPSSTEASPPSSTEASPPSSTEASRKARTT